MEPKNSSLARSRLLWLFPPALRSLPHYPEQVSPEFLVLTSIRINWGALKKDRGSSIAEGSIHHIAVSCDPTDVSHTAKDITWLVVKHELWTQERTDPQGLAWPKSPFSYPPLRHSHLHSRLYCDTATTDARSEVCDDWRGFPQSPAEDRITNTDSNMAIPNIKQYMVHEPRKNTLSQIMLSYRRNLLRCLSVS